MWQCGQLRTAHNVYSLKISRVEVKNFPDYGTSPLTTGGRMYWDGEAGNASGQASRPCTTHKESSISCEGSERGNELHLGYGKQRDAVPNPWRNNLTIDKNFEYKNSKAMEGNSPYQYETTEESNGIAQNMLNGHN